MAGTRRVADVDRHDVDDVTKIGIGRDLERHLPGMPGAGPKHRRRLRHVSGRDAVRKGCRVIGQRRNRFLPVVVMVPMIIMVVVASPLVVMVSMIIMIAVIAATPAGEAEDVILNVAEVEDVVIVEDGTGNPVCFAMVHTPSVVRAATTGE